MPQLPYFLFLISYFLFSNVTLPIEKPTLQEGLDKNNTQFSKSTISLLEMAGLNNNPT